MNKNVNIVLRIKYDPSSIWSYQCNNLTYEKDTQKEYSYSLPDTIPIYLETNLSQTKTERIYKEFIEEKIISKDFSDNILIFAYGQTGSGKTYTMAGTNSSKGLIDCSLSTILGEDKRAEIEMFEIYNEKIYDLNANGSEIMLSLDKTGKLVLKNITTVEILGASEAISLFHAKIENRRCEATKYNETSSRSHFIFQVKTNNKTITFLDLAGSEKASVNKERLIEGKYINVSLLALSNVINALSKNARPTYRDSKLTRILERTLNSESIVIGICLINPIEDFLSDSLRTLRFATKLSNIQVESPVVREQNTIEEILQEYMNL